MPERSEDVFERRLEQRLREFADQSVQPFDAVAIARAAMAGRPVRSVGTRPRFGVWLRPLLLTALLVVGLVAAGIYGGLIKLPTNVIEPNPSFVPFSPPPVSPDPSGELLSPPPGSSAEPTFIPASDPPTIVPGSAVPVTFFPAEAPSPLPPSSATPEPSATVGPFPIVSPVPTETLATPAPTVSVEPTLEPTPPAPAAVMTEVSAGDTHACAIRLDRKIFCWGNNEFGELGDGTNDARYEPSIPVAGITDAIDVAVGNRFTCAVRAGGSVECWGEGGSGQLGNDSTANSSTPARVAGVFDATQVVTGGSHSCALRGNGRVACWGQAKHLGNGSATNDSTPVSSPVEVSNLEGVVQIGAGWNHTCARRGDGTIACWGLNGDGAAGYGGLGDGTLEHASTPVEVVGIADATQVAAGGWSTCAVRAGGSAWCWGYGERGGLGDGSSTNSSTPVQVSGIDDARRIAVGGWHACALGQAGSVRCWGANSWGGSGGQLGDGTRTDRSTPVNVVGLPDMAGLGAGWISTYAVGVDGRLWGWGWYDGDVPREIVVSSDL